MEPGTAAISSVFPAENGQAAASKSNLRWLQVPDLNLSFGKFSEFRRTIGENIVDLRRVGKGGSGLSLPNFHGFARLPLIFCDPLRSMAALRPRERVNSSHKLRQDFGGKLGLRAT